MGILIVTSYLIAGLSPVLLPQLHLSPHESSPQNFLISAHPAGFSPQVSGESGPSLGNLIQRECQSVPNGIGVPAFQPGIEKKDVFRMLGTPNKTSRGYWPNTRAVSYELIPEQISLGFLFDRNSERIRQTEASFTPQVDTQLVAITLNGMLGCKLNEEIHKGLQKVQQKTSPRYSFSLGFLQGVIEWQTDERLYIGIWEADLH
jgi:serine/threonine-protein kinase